MSIVRVAHERRTNFEPTVIRNAMSEFPLQPSGASTTLPELHGLDRPGRGGGRRGDGEQPHYAPRYDQKSSGRNRKRIREVWRRWRPDFLRGVLMILVIFTISKFHGQIGLQAVRPTLMLAGLASFYMFLNPRSITFRGLLNTWPSKVIAGIGLAAVLSIPFGLSIGGSGQYFIASFSKVLILSFLLILGIQRVRDLSHMVTAYVIACLLIIYLAIFVYGNSVVVVDGFSRLNDLYAFDSNDAGLMLMVGVPLAMLLYQTSGWIGKTIAVATMLGTGWTVALTGSRGTLVAFVIVGAALLVTLRQVSFVKRAGIVLGLVGMLSLAAPDGYWNQMMTMFDTTDDYNYTSEAGRIAIIKRGIGYAVERPLFGVGLNNFSRAEGTISDVAQNAMSGIGVPWLAPHNSYLQMLAELGIPAFLLFCALVFGGGYAMYYRHRRLPREWAHGTPEQRYLFLATMYLPISFLAFATAGFFLTFAYLDTIYFLGALTCGVYVTLADELSRWNPRVVTPTERRRSAGGVRGGLDSRTSPQIRGRS